MSNSKFGYNRATVAGYVLDEFKILEQSEENVAISFNLRVDPQYAEGRQAIIPVYAEGVFANTLLTKACRGSLIYSDNCMLRTVNYTQDYKVTCPDCGAEGDVSLARERTDVLMLDGNVVEDPSVLGLAGLNKITLLGNVASLGQPYSKGKFSSFGFKIAIDRINPSQAAKQKADFPFILITGPQADYLATNLKVGQVVHIDGRISARDTDRNIKYKCPACNLNVESKVDNLVVEVYAKHVQIIDRNPAVAEEE